MNNDTIDTLALKFSKYLIQNEYMDCISSSYIFYKLCKIYLGENFNIEIKSGSLREGLDDGEDDLLGDNGHYWCESGDKIYDFTVSQFMPYIEYNNLYKLLPENSYIFKKGIMDKNNIYRNGIDGYAKCKRLNNWLQNYNDLDYSVFINEE